MATIEKKPSNALVAGDYIYSVTDYREPKEGDWNPVRGLECSDGGFRRFRLLSGRVRIASLWAFASVLESEIT